MNATDRAMESRGANALPQRRSRLSPPPAARRRRQYTLTEKLAIVRESQQAGVSQASISRKHNLGKNVLWSWRKSLSGFAMETRQSDSGGDQEAVHLRSRIAALERLLGQKAFEVELLRNRLQAQPLLAENM